MANGNTPQAADLLTLSTLILCMASYEPATSDIEAGVKNTWPLTPGGKWKCVWGPQQDSDRGNLAFVAGYFPSQDVRPQTICVTVRGTDFDIHDIWGVLAQVWEDVDAADPQQVSWAPPSALVAGGTLDGLSLIQKLADPVSGQTIGEYLTEFFSQSTNADVTTLVTGHSLGGCLATVVAPWIRSLRLKYKGTIQPITYAAPTAGNYDFATYYDTQFPLARRYQNSLDVVPLAYYDIGGIDSIYSDYGLPTPDPIWISVLGMKAALDLTGASYVQPAQGQQVLQGAFVSKDSQDWYAQALHQHHVKTYFKMVTGTEIDMATMPEPTVPHPTAARLIKRIGRVDDALRRLAGG